MTRTQYRETRREVRELARWHRHPHNQHEAATWAMYAARMAGVTRPTSDDFRVFVKIGTAALPRHR
jgi:hypothetical protein